MVSTRSPQTNLLKLSPILIFLLRLFITNSQDIQSYQTCPSRDVTLPNPNTNVVITHNPSKNSQSSSQCYLHIKGLNPGGYILLKGASEGVAGRTCEATLVVENDEYCVGGNAVEPAIRIESDGEISIKVDSTANVFEIELVTNYSPCMSAHQSITLGVGKSGVISTRYPTRVEIDPSPENCIVNLSGVPQGATLGVYPLYNNIWGEALWNGSDLMYISEGGSSIMNLYRKRAPLIVPSSGNGNLAFQYLPEVEDEIVRLQFIIQISVLTCGSIPLVENTQIQRTAHNSADSVVEYECAQGYLFEEGSNNSIGCEAKIEDGVIKTGWSSTSQIRCTPMPRCFSTPTIIPNTVQNLISEKVTVYQCSEGYTGHMDNITVICSSPDEDKIPWNWEDSEVEAKLNCFPISCEVPDKFMTVENGKVELNKTHNFNDHLLLTCEHEYSPRYEVRCNSSGYWSAVPECIKTDTSAKVIGISVGVSSGIVLVGLSIVAAVLIIKLRNRNQQNIKRDGYTEEVRHSGSGKLNSSYYEDVVEEPEYLEPVKSQTVISPGSRSGTENLYENQPITHQSGSVKVNSGSDEYEMLDSDRQTTDCHVYAPVKVSSRPGYVGVNQRC